MPEVIYAFVLERVTEVLISILTETPNPQNSVNNLPQKSYLSLNCFCSISYLWEVDIMMERVLNALPLKLSSVCFLTIVIEK